MLLDETNHVSVNLPSQPTFKLTLSSRLSSQETRQIVDKQTESDTASEGKLEIDSLVVARVFSRDKIQTLKFDALFLQIMFL